MTKFDFSVSMCVYEKDNPKWFCVAVESVLCQTIKPEEIVLVVDGPIEGELDEIVSLYEKNDIFNVIRLEKNCGHGVARRIGIENCKNNLIAIMDADDICVSSRFEKQLEIFKENELVDIVGGYITEFVGNEDNIVGKREVPLTDYGIKLYMKKRCPMNQVSVMFKKSIYERAGGYIDWYQDEDYYLWLRMMQIGAIFANVDAVLVNVRVGEDMYKRRGGWKYFRSERRLQKYMLKHNVIGLWTYMENVLKRFIVQVLLPNSVRGWVYKRFARKSR